MRAINLLPWREQLIELRRRKFIINLFGSMVVCVFIILCANYIFSKLIYQKNQNKNSLVNKNNAIKEKIVQANLLEKQIGELKNKNIFIEDLLEKRAKSINSLISLSQIIPSGILVVKIEQKNNILLFSGYADSATTVTRLMRVISTAKQFKNPRVTEIVKDSSRESFSQRFSMAMHI